MIGGPGDSKYVRKKAGPVGFNEDTLAYGRKKRSLSESAVFYFDRFVSFVANPRSYIRDHREYMRLLQGDLKEGENIDEIAKTLTDRKVAIHFSSDDIQLGLKRLKAKELAAKGRDEETDLAEDFNRTRNVRIAEDGGDIKRHWNRKTEKKETSQIKTKMQEEYRARDARNQELSAALREEFGKEDPEILELKEQVANQTVEVQKWQERLESIPWYSSREKHFHYAFEGNRLTRDEIQDSLRKNEEELYSLRSQLNTKLEPLRNRHDQQKYSGAQMKMVNGYLSSLLKEIQETQKSDFENRSEEYRAVTAKKEYIESTYRLKVDWRTEDFRARTSELAEKLAVLERKPLDESQWGDFYKNFPEFDTRASDTDDAKPLDVKHARAVLAARSVAGNALFRMANMTETSKEYEASMSAYLAGEQDPMELKLIAEAEKMTQRQKQKSSKASRLLSWIFQDDEDYSKGERFPLSPPKPEMQPLKPTIAGTHQTEKKEEKEGDLLVDFGDDSGTTSSTLQPESSVPPTSGSSGMGPASSDTMPTLFDIDFSSTKDDKEKK